jgi:hypothetical protein
VAPERRECEDYVRAEPVMEVDGKCMALDVYLSCAERNLLIRLLASVCDRYPDFSPRVSLHDELSSGRWRSTFDVLGKSPLPYSLSLVFALSDERTKSRS